jgi:hypothetical protein
MRWQNFHLLKSMCYWWGKEASLGIADGKKERNSRKEDSSLWFGAYSFSLVFDNSLFYIDFETINKDNYTEFTRRIC